MIVALMRTFPSRTRVPVVAGVLVTTLAAAAFSSGDTAFAPDPAVRATVLAFHAALSDGSEGEALALLHPEVRIFEQGHGETLDEYRAGHLAMDVAFAQEVEREVLRDEVVMGDGSALYLAEVRNQGVFRGQEIDSFGVETAFLVETPEGWRIRHFHWSSRR